MRKGYVYIITKLGQELRSWGTFATHEHLYRDNHLTHSDVVEEGYDEGYGKIVKWPPERALALTETEIYYQSQITRNIYHCNIRREGD